MEQSLKEQAVAVMQSLGPRNPKIRIPDHAREAVMAYVHEARVQAITTSRAVSPRASVADERARGEMAGACDSRDELS